MELTIRYGNVLMVNGRFLQAEDHELLSEALVKGRGLILGAMNEMYKKNIAGWKGKTEKQRDKMVAPVPPSVWVARIFADSDVSWQEIQANIDPVLYTNQPIESDDTKPMWDAVISAGFLPEARIASNPEDMKGLCQLVRTIPYLFPKD